MKSYVTKKTRRICSVPGCGAKESYLLSKSKDLTGSVFLCKDCLEAASALHGALKSDAKKSGKKAATADGGNINEKAGG